MQNEESVTLEKILEVARAEFLEKGFRGASLREVVKKAEGMSKNGRSYTFYACNNLAAHCDYHIMLFGNHEHPGILVK